MNIKSFAKPAAAVALLGASLFTTQAFAFAALNPITFGPVTYSEGCNTGSDNLTASSAPLGVTVTGLISLSTTSTCFAQWTATSEISIATDGYYFFAYNYDYNYSFSGFSNGTAHFEFGGSLTNPPGLNLATGFDFDVIGNGEGGGQVSGGGPGTDSFVYPFGSLVPAGNYTLQQSGTLSITAAIESSADVDFHIPVSTFLLDAPGPGQQIPEPESLALFGAALLAMLVARSRAVR